MLSAWCGEVRMEEPEIRAAFHARRATACRLGNGDRRVGRVSKKREREDHIPTRRIGACYECDERHRARHLYGDDDDRRGVSRRAAGAGEVRAWRHEIP